jgi:transposase InsO family protein
MSQRTWIHVKSFERASKWVLIVSGRVLAISFSPAAGSEPLRSLLDIASSYRTSNGKRGLKLLSSHKDLIVGMDFFVVPTVHFKLLYAWFAIDHGRRRILHFHVTENPTASWVIQQLRHAFPGEPTHRYMILDNDAIFSPSVAHAIASFGIDPKRTAFQSPWQNGTAERFVGSVRRELLYHVVVLHEDHLRRLLREYVEYYNTERVHTSIDDAPEGRAVETRPWDHARVIGLPRVGGLHHRYVWAEAA